MRSTILQLRQVAHRLAKAEGTRDRNRALAELNHCIDELEKTKVSAPSFQPEAVALLLSSVAPSDFFKAKRKYHVRSFSNFDRLVDLVKAANPDYQDISL